jgi:hypothetical protein
MARICLKILLVFLDHCLFTLWVLRRHIIITDDAPKLSTKRKGFVEEDTRYTLSKTD